MSRRIKTIDVDCPVCDARPGRRCRSLRIPSANTLGGGWGGPHELSRSHKLRVEARKIEEQKANLRSFLRDCHGPVRHTALTNRWVWEAGGNVPARLSQCEHRDGDTDQVGADCGGA